MSEKRTDQLAEIATEDYLVRLDRELSTWVVAGELYGDAHYSVRITHVGGAWASGHEVSLPVEADETFDDLETTEELDDAMVQWATETFTNDHAVERYLADHGFDADGRERRRADPGRTPGLTYPSSGSGWGD